MKTKEETAAYRKKWQQENKDRVRISQRKYEAANREKLMVKGAKLRAKKKGIPFDLAPEDIIIPEYCPYLEIKLKYGEGAPIDSSPSLDRIAPELGYVKGNIQILSKLANQIKTNATPEQVMMVALKMKETT